MSDRRLDAAIAALWLCVGLAAGSLYYRQTLLAGGSPYFYQNSFGPAVMWACGQGFVVPEDTAVPALHEFLANRIDRFDCAALPSPVPPRAAEGSQPWLVWSHLIRAAAVIWRVAGISWIGLWPIAGLFFGATGALGYILFRTVAGPVLASTGAAFVLTSPLFLTELPQFRDYSKVPFMLAIAWILAQLATPLAPRRVLWLSLLYGAVFGLSTGFRNDSLITIPVFLFLLLVARREDPGHLWREKAIGATVAIAVAGVLALPVARGYTSGGGAFMSHAALLGMMSPVDREIGITNDGLYNVGDGNDDSYAAAVVGAAATRMAGHPQPIIGHSRDYDDASTRYVRALVTAMPADQLVRGYGAALKILELPSSQLETAPPPHIESRILARAFSIRARLLRSVYWIWPIAFGLAFMILASRDLRLAIALGLAALYLMAYPAVQFQQRHILHLGLIPVAGLLFVAQSLISRKGFGSLRGSLIFAMGAAAVIVLPLVGARWWQQQTLTNLIASYLIAPAEELPRRSDGLPDDTTSVELPVARWSEDAKAHPDSVLSDLLILEVRPCNLLRVSATIRYASSDPSVDFSRQLSIPVRPPTGRPIGDPDDASSITRSVISTFSYYASQQPPIWYWPMRLELPASEVRCLSRVATVRPTTAFPVLLNARLMPDWVREPWYKTLDWESRPLSAPSVQTAPANLHVPANAATAIDPLATGDVAEIASNASFASDGRLTVSGAGGLGGTGALALLVRFKTTVLHKGQQLYGEGMSDGAGFTIGLVKDDQWVTQLPVFDRGPFVVSIAAPEDASYQVVIANNISGASLSNHFSFAKLGWMK